MRYTIDEHNQLRLEQSDVAPTVYLDHWAVRHMSDDPYARDEFTSVLKAREGTLALSWLNLLEFTPMTDVETHRRAETLIEQMLPNVFFMESNPFVVIKRENQLLGGAQPLPPHADCALLREFGNLPTTSLAGFTAEGLISPMHGSAVEAEFGALADAVVLGVEGLRSELTGNVNFQHVIQRPPSGPPIQRGTRYVFRELARTFLVDKALKISRNNAIDLLHSVVPVAYCDYVLLDAHWEEQVARVRTRFANTKMQVPLANVFSKKSTGLKRFLAALAKSDGQPF